MCVQNFDEVGAVTTLIDSDSTSELDAIESRAVDALVRERLMLLDAVNEVLSRRVMDNYSDFVNGTRVISDVHAHATRDNNSILLLLLQAKPLFALSSARIYMYIYICVCVRVC